MQSGDDDGLEGKLLTSYWVTGTPGHSAARVYGNDEEFRRARWCISSKDSPHGIPRPRRNSLSALGLHVVSKTGGRRWRHSACAARFLHRVYGHRWGRFREQRVRDHIYRRWRHARRWLCPQSPSTPVYTQRFVVRRASTGSLASLDSAGRRP
jgi:hypothetical protein